MTIDAEIEKVHGLLARLIRAIIDRPSFLDLRAEPLPARVNWFVSVHIDDQGKVIGKKGCHIKALQFLIALIGMRYGSQYFLEVNEPDVPPRGRSAPNRPRIAETYDEQEAVELIDSLLTEILASDTYRLGTSLNQQPDSDGRLKFKFIIAPSDEKTRAALTMQCDPIGNGNAQSVESALGTLFRAYGLVDGVAFTVEVLP